MTFCPPESMVSIPDESSSHVSVKPQETGEVVPEEQGPILETETSAPESPTDLSLPETTFDSHSTLDEEFDIFEAAEEVVRYLDAVEASKRISRLRP